MLRSDVEITLSEIISLMSRPNGASVKEICEKTGCSRTGFYRYKEKLESFNIPIYEKDDYNGNTSSKRWYIDKDVYTQTIPLRLNHIERMTLRSILDRTEIFKKTKLNKHMESLKAKLNAALIHDTKQITHSTFYNLKGIVSYEGKENIIDTLYACIENQQCYTLYYLAAGKEKAFFYEVEPYTLVNHNNILYVLVAIPKYDRVIYTFAVNRIQTIEKTKNYFRIPDTFNPKEYFEPAFGIVGDEPIKVRIHFSKNAAFYIKECIWGKDQKIEVLDDKSIILTFYASGEQEIISWILSWGSYARVLEPESIISKVQTYLKQALEKY